jgi:hypothetical protein
MTVISTAVIKQVEDFASKLGNASRTKRDFYLFVAGIVAAGDVEAGQFDDIWKTFYKKYKEASGNDWSAKTRTNRRAELLTFWNIGTKFVGHAVELAELFERVERVRLATKSARENISNVDALVKVAIEFMKVTPENIEQVLANLPTDKQLAQFLADEPVEHEQREEDGPELTEDRLAELVSKFEALPAEDKTAVMGLWKDNKAIEVYSFLGEKLGTTLKEGYRLLQRIGQGRQAEPPNQPTREATQPAKQPGAKTSEERVVQFPQPNKDDETVEPTSPSRNGVAELSSQKATEHVEALVSLMLNSDEFQALCAEPDILTKSNVWQVFSARIWAALKEKRAA